MRVVYPKRILIIAPFWVGDMVMTQALLSLIKRRNSNCYIDVFASPFLHPLIQRMPEVNLCIDSPFKGGDLMLLKRFKIGRSLKKNRYTHAYVIPNSFKSALIPFFARIPSRVGWRGEQRYVLLNDIRVLNKNKPLSTVESFVLLGCKKDEPLPTPMPLPELQVSVDNLDLVLSRLNLTLPKKPVLALCPGSAREEKCWPTEHFASIAAAKKNAGWDVWIFGGAKEQELAAMIQKKCNHICLDLTGKTDLGEAVDLLSLATAVVANDSGLMHVASALHKPVVAIYGPTPPQVAPPLTRNKFKILSLNLPCSPCQWDCQFDTYQCLSKISPLAVLAAIEQVIS